MAQGQIALQVAGATPRLELSEISKSFDTVRVLYGVNLSVQAGEIHALCGENGAGKSTLMKILSGVYGAGDFEGTVKIDGIGQTFHDVRDAERAGVAIIFQELSLLDNLTVAENICLAHEPKRLGLVHHKAMREEAARWLGQLKVDLNPDVPVGELGVGQKQLVEIAKALRKRPKVLVLDEPTSALTETETARLLSLLKDLSAGGMACVLISHKLEEVFAVADRITVLRDGRKISTRDTRETSTANVVAEMVGRELTQLFPYRPRKFGDVALQVRNWTVPSPQGLPRPSVDGLSFEVRRGEILGISGLMGAGRTELLMSLFGALPFSEGEVWVNGTRFIPTSPAAALKQGLALITEDRKRFGLILDQSVTANLTLSTLKRHAKMGLLRSGSEVSTASRTVERLRVKVPGLSAPVRSLSGGNQQKVVLGKFLLTEAPILLLDEPTRGIDVGAKAEIYELLMELAESGYAVVMASSELPEVLGVCDRVLVMAEGRLSGAFDRESATQERVMECAVKQAGV